MSHLSFNEFIEKKLQGEIRLGDNLRLDITGHSDSDAVAPLLSLKVGGSHGRRLGNDSWIIQSIASYHRDTPTPLEAATDPHPPTAFIVRTFSR